MNGQFNEIPNIPKTELRPDIPQIQTLEEFSEEDIEDPLWLDFQSGDDAEGIKSAGEETYVISPVTEQNLFSDKYLNCTGVVGIGRDKASGKEIAFISHQDPEYFLNKGPEFTERFESDLKTTLSELLILSEDNTVEVVVFGGNIDSTDPASKKTVDYAQSLGVLNSVIRNVIGREPTVIKEPNNGRGAVDITVLTQTRKIAIVR